MGRHLEAAQLQQAETAGGAVGGIELVDAEFGAVGVALDVGQDVAQRPVDQPGRRLGPGAGDLLEGDLELIERIVARLVDARRLAGRADRTGRRTGRTGPGGLPVIDHAAQQVRPAQNGLSPAVAAPTTIWLPPPVPTWRPSIMNFSLPRWQSRASASGPGCCATARPAPRPVDIDLDHAGVGGHRQHVEARVARRAIAFEITGMSRSTAV